MREKTEGLEADGNAGEVHRGGHGQETDEMKATAFNSDTLGSEASKDEGSDDVVLAAARSGVSVDIEMRDSKEGGAGEEDKETS